MGPLEFFCLFIGGPCVVGLIWLAVGGIYRDARPNRRTGLRSPDPKCVVSNWTRNHKPAETR